MARLDPAELFELVPDRPDVTGTVLVEALDGFIDAGLTVKIARTHLLASLDHAVIARFDVDQLYDYRARRPLMRFDHDHWDSYDAPELALHLVHDCDGKPFLLLTGPEPDVQWERFVAAVQLLVEQLGVRLTVGLDAFPMSLPHTRPTRVIMHGSRRELFDGYHPWLGQIMVPASAGHLLELRLGQAGHDALGLGVPVPPYLTQSEYPAAAVAMLRELSDRVQLTFPLAALDQAAEKARLLIDQEMAQSEEVTALVKALEEQYDAYARGHGRSLLTPEGTLPSGDELGEELEQFLAEQSRGGDGSGT